MLENKNILPPDLVESLNKLQFEENKDAQSPIKNTVEMIISKRLTPEQFMALSAFEIKVEEVRGSIFHGVFSYAEALVTELFDSTSEPLTGDQLLSIFQLKTNNGHSVLYTAMDFSDQHESIIENYKVSKKGLAKLIADTPKNEWSLVNRRLNGGRAKELDEICLFYEISPQDFLKMLKHRVTSKKANNYTIYKEQGMNDVFTSFKKLNPSPEEYQDLIIHLRSDYQKVIFNPVIPIVLTEAVTNAGDYVDLVLNSPNERVENEEETLKNTRKAISETIPIILEGIDAIANSRSARLNKGKIVRKIAKPDHSNVVPMKSKDQPLTKVAVC
jgi:hypothetical protein